jgi:hypothetical protein
MLDLSKLPDQPSKLNISLLPDQPSRLNIDLLPDKPTSEFNTGISRLPTEQPKLEWTAPGASVEPQLRRAIPRTPLTPEQQAQENSVNLDVQFNQLADNIATVGFDTKDEAVKTKKKQDFIMSRAPLVAMGMGSPIAAGAFEGIQQLKNIAVSNGLNEPYNPLSTRQVSEFLPKDTNSAIKTGLSVAEMLGDVAITGTLMNLASKGLLNKSINNVADKITEKYGQEQGNSFKSVMNAAIKNGNLKASSPETELARLAKSKKINLNERLPFSDTPQGAPARPPELPAKPIEGVTPQEQATQTALSTQFKTPAVTVENGKISIDLNSHIDELVTKKLSEAGITVPKSIETAPTVPEIATKPPVSAPIPENTPTITPEAEITPKIAVPEFKTTNEALKYGIENQGNLDLAKQLRSEVDNITEQLKTVKGQEGVNLATKSQLLRESAEAIEDPKQAQDFLTKFTPQEKAVVPETIIEKPAKIFNKGTVQGLQDIANKSKTPDDFRLLIQKNGLSGGKALDELYSWAKNKSEYKDKGWFGIAEDYYSQVKAPKKIFNKAPVQNNLVAMKAELKDLQKQIQQYNMQGKPFKALPLAEKSNKLRAEIAKIEGSKFGKPSERGSVDMSIMSDVVDKLTPREREIITAVGRALGDKQSQEFAVKYKWNDIVDEFYNKKITAEDSIALGNYYDNPTKYPLSETIKNKLGDDLISKNLEFKKFLTQEQKSRGLLDTEINDEEYLRTFLTQENGETPTPAQLNKLLENSSPSIAERLMGINNPAGGGGLSFKNKFNQSRKFENADLRDEYLKQFGLKTDRNYINVMRRTVNQVTKTTSNYDFVQSLRKQAKENMRGIKEIYDPKVFKDFKDNLHDEYIAIRDKILANAKEAKMITEAEYMDGKRDSRIMIDVLKHNGVTKFKDELPNDLKQMLLDDMELEYSAIRDGLFADFKGQKETFNYNAKQMIEEARNKTKAKITEEVNKISERYANALTEEYRRPKDMRIAQQMTGLMFDKASANSLDKIFEILKPSSLEDTVRAVKLMMATGDLFQLPEIVRQRFGVAGMKGLTGVYKYTENEFYTKGIDAVKSGLVLGKPADMDIELIKKMGQTIEKGDESMAMKVFNKMGEIGSKIPVFNKGEELVTKGFGALEDLQWKIALPHAKLAMWDKSWQKIAKKNPNISTEEAKTTAAEFINDTFQGLNWQRIMASDSLEGKFINKRIERATRILLFGSDRFLSLVNRYTKGFRQNGAEYRKFWIRSAIAGLVITEALNYALNGKSTLENKKGNEFSVEVPWIKDEKGNPMAVNVIGTWQEPLRALDKPGSYLLNKQGTLTRMLGFGQPEYAKPKTLMQFMWNNVPMPFTLQNLLKQLNKSPKDKTGEVDFNTALTMSALEFAGFPTTFRTGTNKQARLTDLLSGNADPYQYLTSQDIKQEKKIFNKSSRKVFNKPRYSGAFK